MVWSAMQVTCVIQKFLVMTFTEVQGTWVAQLVNHLTLAQVMIPRFVGSSPTLGSMLAAQSLEPASDSVSPSLSLSLFLLLRSCSLSLSLKNE